MPHPFSARACLFLMVPDSDLAQYLEEGYVLAQRHPEILSRIDADLDRHSLSKKSSRERDAEWERGRNGVLPEVGDAAALVKAKPPHLGVGSPRTPALVVYLAMLFRGYQGGFKTGDTVTLMQESTTWSVVLANLGLSMPKPGTLEDLVNQISNETRSLVLDLQMADVLAMGWDDFSCLLADSTAVDGNTQWPKDSRLIVMLTERVLTMGSRLDRVGLPAFTDANAVARVKKMASFDKEISLGAGKAVAEPKRVALYNKLLTQAGKVRRALEPRVAAASAALQVMDALPTLCERAARAVAKMKNDLEALGTVIACCRARVVHGKKVPVAEKVLSVADDDVGFIAKGGREPVVGYKPQLARSGEGFVVAFLLPQGNAADATQLLPLFVQAFDRTGIIPKEVSVDDGYASGSNRLELLGYGVDVVSISGSKGKRITSEEDWDSLEYVAARNGRSAVESLMFTIKHGFDFGRVARRGLAHVTAEMLEKVLAYNFCRMSSCRREDREEVQPLNQAA